MLWGLGHGLLASLEGSGIIPVARLQKSRAGRILCRVYTLLAVMLLFTLFRADTVSQGFGMIAAMFRFRAFPAAGLLLAKLLNPAMVLVLLAALVLSLGPGEFCHSRLTADGANTLVSNIFCILIYLLSLFSLAQSGFHPFIYFQF